MLPVVGSNSEMADEIVSGGHVGAFGIGCGGLGIGIDVVALVVVCVVVAVDVVSVVDGIDKVVSSSSSLFSITSHRVT